MKRLITLALVAVSFYSCTESMDSGDTVNNNCGTITNVAFESLNYCGELKEKPVQPVYVITNTKEDLDKRFTTCANSTVVLPDFTQKRILGLFAGPKPTAGYGIQIQSVLENDCQMLVEYFEKSPIDGENVTTGITYPADYIVLPKSNKPIIFSKVNKIADYAVVGTYYGNCNGADCYQFYRIEKYKVLQYLKVNTLPTDFTPIDYKALGYIDDYASFLLKVPTEIKDLKGQTKTYGSPDAHDQGGVYFEWSQGGKVTKIYFDTENSADQTPEVIAFKKVIQDKVTELKTKS